MKNFVILLFFIPLFAGAQTTHKVEAKETLYSLARKYNVHPRELATYNNIPVGTALTLGQVIKIPSKTTMAPLPPVATEKTEPVTKTVTEPKPPAPVKQDVKQEVKQEGSYPVYHKVEKKETLYHISKLYPDATIADIKKWNKLTTDGLSEGTDLIVGYSKTKNAEPVKKEMPQKAPVVNEIKTVITKPAEPIKKEDAIVKTEPVKKEEVKSVTGKIFNGGVFKTMYTEQTAVKKDLSEEKGPAGIFKSTSGWEDGKYYCLTNTAPAGTIVKVTNNNTRKSVYAKVLDLIPDLKQNSGIIVRISNAAAEELGASTDNFDCTLNF